MKNKQFAILVVALAIILAMAWNAHRTYETNLEKMKKAMTELDLQVYLLELKAKTLKSEVEMMRLKQAAVDRQMKTRRHR